jgi:hypothetical protein
MSTRESNMPATMATQEANVIISSCFETEPVVKVFVFFKRPT